MINALDMTRAQYVMMFGRSEITHAMAEGWSYDNAESMVTLCGRKGGSVSHFDSGSLQEVTCKRCVMVMTKIAAQKNTDEMIAESEARISSVTVQGESDIPVFTSADGPIGEFDYDAYQEELHADPEVQRMYALEAESKRLETGIQIVTECMACGKVIPSENVATHLHFRPVWQLLTQGVSVESAIVSPVAPNGSSFGPCRELTRWYRKDENETGSESVAELVKMIDQWEEAFSLYEMPNHDVVVAWRFDPRTDAIGSVFYVTLPPREFECYGENGHAVHVGECAQAKGVDGPCCSIEDDGTDANALSPYLTMKNGDAVTIASGHLAGMSGVFKGISQNGTAKVQFDDGEWTRISPDSLEYANDAGFVETMVTQEYRLSVTVDGAQIDLGWHEFTVNAAQANDVDVIAALYGERHGSGKPRHGWGSIISVTDVMGD